MLNADYVGKAELRHTACRTAHRTRYRICFFLQELSVYQQTGVQASPVDRRPSATSPLQKCETPATGEPRDHVYFSALALSACLCKTMFVETNHGYTNCVNELKQQEDGGLEMTAGARPLNVTSVVSEQRLSICHADILVRPVTKSE